MQTIATMIAMGVKAGEVPGGVCESFKLGYKRDFSCRAPDDYSFANEAYWLKAIHFFNAGFFRSKEFRQFFLDFILHLRLYRFGSVCASDS